jgi:Outer membrane protein beta-barrel domain
MKKLLLMITVLLISGATMAQGSKGKVTKSFLAFHGGPSIPVGDFGSSDFNNEKAGFTKTGFTLNLNYGYNFNKHVGLTGAAFYNRFNLDKSAFLQDLPGVNADHWQFYGLTAGPMLNHELSDKVVLDLRVMGGLANANTPKFTYEGTEVVKEDWKWTPVFQGGVNLRFNTGGNVFIFTNADYMWMQPEFKLMSSGGDGATLVDRIHQTIAVANLTGGVGIRF